MSRVLFVGWEGCVVETRGQSWLIDTRQLQLSAGVVPALLRFSEAGYRIVPTTNRRGIDEAQARQAGEVDDLVIALLRSQGITIENVRVCPHEPQDDCDCRRPGVGLAADLLPDLDRAASHVVDQNEPGAAFARNLGIGFVALDVGDAQITWPELAHRLLDRPRQAQVSRRTRETDICVKIDLDDPHEPSAQTGLPFFDHMLEQIGKHGGFRLEVRCKGDLEVDEHHTIEDVALAIGTALRKALGDKRGIERYGFVLPMDETRAEVSIDLGGRPYLVFDANFPREQVGGMPTELVEHFFRSFSDTLGATLNISVSGENTHHMIEACFKGLARALRVAVRRSGDVLPSTKGVL